MTSSRGKRPSAAETVAAELRKRILGGRLSPGELLPAEGELAEAFGFSRLTIREAIKSLSSHGLVRVQQGMGTEVQDFRISGSLDLLPALLRVQRDEEGRITAAWTELLRDVLEVRRILAANMVELACERAGPGDLSALRKQAAAQAKHVDDPAAFAEGDIRFTRLVLGCCKNLAVELTFNTVLRTVDSIPSMVESMILPRRNNLQFYELVIGLIAAREGPAARAAVSEGLRAMDEALLASLAARTSSDPEADPR